MRSPEISVIVPVYNAGKYLHRCIDSILAQTFTDFELLLVDDGSKDDSGASCDEYAARDGRIKVFHKENGGVSSARQLGINEANGIFSIHADSDDWVENDMLERLHDVALRTEADIVIADYYEDNRNRSIHVPQCMNSTKSEEIIAGFFTHKLIGSVWNKLVRHSLYKENDISFPKNINYCEDLIVICKLLLAKPHVEFINEAFYHYDISRSVSITRSYTHETYLQYKAAIEYMANLLPQTFNHLLSEIALEAKGEALKHGFLNKQELLGFMHVGTLYIIMSIMHYATGRRLKARVLFAQIFGMELGDKIYKKCFKQ